jgi:hypothetical protein
MTLDDKMDDKKSPKIPMKFFCEKCNYGCRNKKDLVNIYLLENIPRMTLTKYDESGEKIPKKSPNE